VVLTEWPRSRINKQFPDTRFVIAGEEYKTSLEDLGFKQTLIDLAEELGISESVEFVGYTSDLRDLYRQSSVVVLASFEETFGLVALEAMAAARPIVASRIPGVTELITDGETGLLFEAGNNEQLAERMIVLLSDRELTERIVRQTVSIAKREYGLHSSMDRLQAVTAST